MGPTPTSSRTIKLKYLVGSHAMHTVEDEGETNTNSLVVNDDLHNSANIRGALNWGQREVFGAPGVLESIYMDNMFSGLSVGLLAL